MKRCWSEHALILCLECDSLTVSITSNDGITLLGFSPHAQALPVTFWIVDFHHMFAGISLCTIHTMMHCRLPMRLWVEFSFQQSLQLVFSFSRHQFPSIMSFGCMCSLFHLVVTISWKLFFHWSKKHRKQQWCKQIVDSASGVVNKKVCKKCQESVKC